MKVWLDDGRAVTLGQREFVARGGEGAVYARGGTAYKVLTDPAKVIPRGKLVELQAIADDGVIRPQRHLVDARGTPIGHTMPFITAAHALCQLFPRAFRDRHRLDSGRIVALIGRLRDLVRAVHRAGALVVDLNEMNVLVARDFSDLFLIDADSFQTPGFRATALSESIRDRHAAANAFSELTDWFAFAIVSFQMLVGIHPFKGKHPTVSGLEERMQQNLSVLSPAVRVPRAAYPFSVIPSAYRSWYEAVFDRGQRLPPPAAGGAVAVALQPSTAAGAGSALRVTELMALDGVVRALWERRGRIVALTDTGLWVDGRRLSDLPAPGVAVAVGFSPLSNHPILATITNGALQLVDLFTAHPIANSLAGDALASHDGRIYVHGGGHVVELVLRETRGGVQVSPRVVANVSAHASHLYDGVVTQSLLGATWVSLFTASGTARQLRLPELDAYRIVAARYDRAVLLVHGVQGGRFDRLIFRFAEDHATWDVRVVADVGPGAAIDCIVLDSGVSLLVTEDHLELFQKCPGTPVWQVDTGSVFDGSSRLYRIDGGAAFTRGDRLYRVTMAP